MAAVQMDPDGVDAAAEGMQARARDLAAGDPLRGADVPPAVAAALGDLVRSDDRLTGAASRGLAVLAGAVGRRVADVRSLDRFVR